MGYGHRLRVQRSADSRVLKAQLDLIADAVEGARLTSPLWALGVAYLASDAFGHLGSIPLNTTLVFPGLIVVVLIGASWLVHRYRNDVIAHTDSDLLRGWFPRFITMQIVLSAAWGIGTWILWDSTSSQNHLFLALSTICVMSGFVISRATHADMFMAGVLPIAGLTFAVFALGNFVTDWVVAALLPTYVIVLMRDGTRLTRRLDDDSRLRFEVEDLARELEEARDEALNKRFEAEAANASKTAFLANMSHELRTPLNAILGFSEIIAKECLGSVGVPRYREYAGDIHTSGAHLLSLINDLLDVAKIEAGKMDIEPRVLEAEKALLGALKLVSAKARERDQSLAVEVAPDAPHLYADERALKQIVLNLVSNAVKFTPEGGAIKLKAKRARCGGFELCVEDNGPGIPKQKLDRIFKPFSQVDNRYDRQQGGTGLGLALVRGLAELHGGRAWIESDAGKGVRAYVVFPVKKAEATSAPPREVREAIPA